MTKKLTFQFVQQFFIKHKCKLLETIYINVSTKMKYICSCGNKSTITFDNFQRCTRCLKYN